MLPDAPSPADTQAVLRFVRILVSVTVSVIAATMISSALWSGGDGHITYRIAAPLLLLMVVLPLTLIFIGILTAVLFFIDCVLKRVRNHDVASLRWISTIWVLGALTLTSLGTLVPLVGTAGIFLGLYWIMAGRLMGANDWSVRCFPIRRQVSQLVLLVLLLVAGTMAFDRLSTVYWGLLPVAPGTPQVTVQFDREMTWEMKRALRRFPNPQSCLKPGADASLHNDLLKMDWDQIRTKPEAQVCAFRLLASLGNATEAEKWVGAQGFRNFFTRPETGSGNLMVQGTWSIHQNGPLFPSKGLLGRLNAAMPHTMSFSARFSPDGGTLLSVRFRSLFL